MDMSKFIIIHTDYNWADEMDVKGFTVMLAETADKNSARLKAYFDKGGDSIEYSVGTNEYITIGSYHEYTSSTVRRALSISEYEALKAVFVDDGLSPIRKDRPFSYGLPITASNWLDVIDEEEEE